MKPRGSLRRGWVETSSERGKMEAGDRAETEGSCGLTSAGSCLLGRESGLGVGVGDEGQQSARGLR